MQSKAAKPSAQILDEFSNLMTLKELLARTSLKDLGREVGLDVQMVEGHLVCTQLDPDDPRYSMDFVMPSIKMISACRADDFDFFQPFIAAGKLTVEDMHHAAQRYQLGKTKSGQPMYWMIDDMLQPLDAHIGQGCWISQLLKKREPILSSWQVHHCLFGLHLLCSEKPICVVESELFEPLQGRTVNIYPCTDPCMSNLLFFEELCESVCKHYDITISVDRTLEHNASDDQRSRCIDLLDFLRESLS